MAYASPGDLVDRYDERTISELLSDTEEPVADITSNDKLLAILAGASGRVDAALLVSGNYTTDELTSLTGNSLALLKDIVCDLAMGRLLRRRPEKIGADSIAAASQDAEDYLDRLRKGERLFDVGSHVDAGQPEVTGPTTLDYARLNLIPDRTKNFYPPRSKRLPIGR